MPLILGIVVLILLLWAASSFAKADPKRVRRLLRAIGGIAALLFAAFMLVRGEIAVAVPVGLLGAGLLGWLSVDSAGSFGRGLRRLLPASQVRTACLEMQLNHFTGTMHGLVLAGRHEGATLDSLDLQTLIGLFDEFDADSGDLLAAYLDRRQPGWREHAQSDPAAGEGVGSSPPGGKMTEQEAYQILGLQPGASAQEIGRAHRFLMKKLHPDQGGSTYLAARVNEAKDVLLRRHR